MYAAVDELPGRTRPATSLPTANQWLSSTEGIGGMSHIATSAPPKSGQPDYAEASESVNTSTLSLTEARPADGPEDPTSTPVSKITGNKRDKTKRKTQPKPKPKANQAHLGVLDHLAVPSVRLDQDLTEMKTD